MNKAKKIFLTLLAVNFLGLFFLFSSSANASTTTTVTATCSKEPFVVGASCDNFSDIKLTVTTLTGDVVLGANSFDDWGQLQITKPDGTLITLATSVPGEGDWMIRSLPGGSMKTANFNLLGNYTIRAWAGDIIGNAEGGTKASATFSIVTHTPPDCSLTVDHAGVFSGNTATLSWTTYSATAVTLNGNVVSANGTQTTSPITGTANFTLIATGDPPSCTKTVTVGLITAPTGGLIPCGRLDKGDDLANIDMSKPCDICAVFYLLKKIINFITALSVGIGVFILILAGLLYALSAGDSHKIELAKSAVTATIIGLAIISVAWLVIAVILQGMGYANIGTWSQVNCILPQV